MEFKEWLNNSGYDDHDILVSHNGEEMALHPAETDQSRDFTYLKDDGYETTFRIMPMMSQRKGFARDPSGRADFMGIFLFTKVHAGKGADVAFIKALLSGLTSRGTSPVPYKNVGLGMFSGLLRGAAEKMNGKEREELERSIEATKDKEFRSGSEIPQFGKGSDNTVGVGKTISVGSSSWSFLFHTGRRGTAGQNVEMIIGLMKKSLEPLMASGVVHRYSVSSRGRELESGASEAGDEEDRNIERDVRTKAGYIKFLARTMLPERTRDMVVERLNYTLSGWQWKPDQIGESKEKVNMDELLKFANETDSQLIVFFVEAIKENDKGKFIVLDELASLDNKRWHLEDDLVYGYKGLVDDGWDHFLEMPLSYAGDVAEYLENEEFFEKVARNEYNAFKTEYKEKFLEALRNHGGKYLGKHERESILKLTKLLGLEEVK